MAATLELKAANIPVHSVATIRGCSLGLDPLWVFRRIKSARIESLAKLVQILFCGKPTANMTPVNVTLSYRIPAALPNPPAFPLKRAPITIGCSEI